MRTRLVSHQGEMIAVSRRFLVYIYEKTCEQGIFGVLEEQHSVYHRFRNLFFQPFQLFQVSTASPVCNAVWPGTTPRGTNVCRNAVAWPGEMSHVSSIEYPDM